VNVGKLIADGALSKKVSADRPALQGPVFDEGVKLLHCWSVSSSAVSLSPLSQSSVASSNECRSMMAGAVGTVGGYYEIAIGSNGPRTGKQGSERKRQPTVRTAMNIQTATKDYEDWVSRHTHVIKNQLSDKHKQMAESPVQFLRGTFYRWAQLFPEICPELRKAPEVLVVGDLHIASFGTWRDGFGRLIWGIDDFDEAYPLPYTNDLVRLGVSAILDASEGEIKVGLGNVVDVILDGYRACLSAGGKPLVLEEKHKWLRNIALNRLDVPADFWKKMDDLPASRTDVPADARKAIARLLPAPKLSYRIVHRIAGVGSLGHPRYVAMAEWQGGQIALEAKAAIPSACLWARPAASSRIYYQLAMDQAIRCPDPFVRLSGKWLVRQLAPDSSPIDIETMSGQKDQDKLLHAMAWEAANVHLGSARAAARIAADLKSRSSKWLRTAIKDMAAATIGDWKEWKKSQS
jgi:hypothetical protein